MVTSYMTYQLPTGILQPANGYAQYRLIINKQAGTGPEPLSVSITLPEHTELGVVSPQPTKMIGSTIHFSLTLDKDTEIVVNYR